MINTHIDVVCRYSSDTASNSWPMVRIVSTLSPDILAMDELNDEKDAAALLDSRGKGVTVLATAHGASVRELRMRPAIRMLLSEGVFKRIVILHGIGRCRAVCDEKENRLDGSET